jgi:ABC-type oligopeptide transport system substrate-binding subunit
VELAGFSVRDFKLVDTATGEPLTIEFLLANPAYERVVLFYKQSLERLGIGVTVRTVDDAQYQNRLRHWDFDIVIESWTETLSPGNEQRDYWGSQAAVAPGSRNIVGTENKAVDSLINKVVFAKDREELVAATRALDRVLLWNHYVVPQWIYGKVRTVRWDRFAKPDRMPTYGLSAFRRSGGGTLNGRPKRRLDHNRLPSPSGMREMGNAGRVDLRASRQHSAGRGAFVGRVADLGTWCAGGGWLRPCRAITLP